MMLVSCSKLTCCILVHLSGGVVHQQHGDFRGIVKHQFVVENSVVLVLCLAFSAYMIENVLFNLTTLVCAMLLLYP